MIREKHKLQKLYNRKPITYGSKFRAIRNKLNSMLRNAKNYYKNKLSSSNLKETWGIVGNLLGRTRKTESSRDILIDNCLVDDPESIANGFNAYFSSIGQTASKFGGTGDYQMYMQQCNVNF